MSQTSAGLLMVRLVEKKPEFFLVHPGGPFYVKKNEGVWSIPKGLPNDNEDLLVAAKREFMEETGIKPIEPFHSIGTITTKSRKIVHAWLFEGEWNEQQGIVCNTFELEWPPRSGKKISVPEVDRAAWMDYVTAMKMITEAQIPFLNRALKLFTPA